MSTPQVGRGRLKLLIIAAIFIAPLIVAAVMYYGQSSLQPEGRTNFGRLLEPIVNLNDVTAGSLNALTDGEADGHWTVILAEPGTCADSCREALYRMRQTRLMLGNDMSRVLRVFLHGDTPPDTVWLGKEHAGLVATRNAALSSILDEKRPAGAKAGGMFLVDPLGNLVLYFPADLAPEDLVSDLEHLLKLSRIG